MANATGSGRPSARRGVLRALVRGGERPARGVLPSGDLLRGQKQNLSHVPGPNPAFWNSPASFLIWKIVSPVLPLGSKTLEGGPTTSRSRRERGQCASSPLPPPPRT
jgi:hypothetical protein